MPPTFQTLEQRVAHLESELARISALLPSEQTSHPQDITSATTDASAKNLPFGALANDPYFDELLQQLREELELDTDNPAYK